MKKKSVKEKASTAPGTVVIALGGNAISIGKRVMENDISHQFLRTRQSLAGAAELIEKGYRVILTHGNGPQVGNELIRVERSAKIVPSLPLGIIVADIQGGMGYMLEQCLQNVLLDRGIQREVTCLVTQVLVDPDDPSMKNPTKFVGPFYREDQVESLRKKRGWVIKEDAGRGWRRVVPSPRPLQFVDRRVIRTLLENDIIVIAGGGGGVPVYTDHRGWIEGVDAVIDKDWASAILGLDIGAQELMIVTGVDQVAIHFGKPQQQFLSRLTLAEARQYLAEGHFPAGSMGPKMAAAIHFLENGGRRVIITSVEKSADAFFGDAGTQIVVQ